MKTGKMQKLIASSKGYTMIELVAVMLIMATIFAIAAPSFLQWWQNLQYRSTARAISVMLRDARSRAISEDVQYRVEFQPPAAVTKYRMDQGIFSANSPTWTPVTNDWSKIVSGVTVTFNNFNVPITDGSCNNNCIYFYPDGTISSVNPHADILIPDSSGIHGFQVDVAKVGRISVSRY
jgi:prepilin-type N-terminal cleavage/methylation domain-containing protein